MKRYIKPAIELLHIHGESVMLGISAGLGDGNQLGKGNFFMGENEDDENGI